MGYEEFCIIDASGNWSKMAMDITTARITQAGAMPSGTYAALAELMSTWSRADVSGAHGELRQGAERSEDWPRNETRKARSGDGQEVMVVHVLKKERI